ncbi:MAG: aminotransferase class V-fold PLP-dependent enzyme [Anaerolineae bacterium]
MLNQTEQIIYMDNAATSWPKAPGVTDAIANLLQHGLASPGRGSHRLALAGTRMILSARQELAALFHLDDPLRVIFTANVTEAINLVLWGWLRPGDRVVTTSMEHNAVMRPLRALERERGVRVHQVQADEAGRLSLDILAQALSGGASLMVVNHASNVVGTIAPLAEIARLCRDLSIPILVDAAQTAGVLPIDMQALDIDMLAFTGHKGLLGPTGTGGLCLGPRVDSERLRPLVYGGTGSRSEEESQPNFLPDRYESGTPNIIGIACLTAALRFLRQETVERVHAHEQQLTTTLLQSLQTIRRVRLYGTLEPEAQVAVVSFNIEGMDGAEVASRLDEEYGIISRVGLHCAPSAHRTIGTFPQGTVRLGLGYFTTPEEIDYVSGAIAAIAH